jgi:hypothetical protein
MLGHTLVLVRGQIPFKDRVPILFVQTCKNLGKSAGALTPGAVHSEDHADLSINVQSAMHHTPQSNVEINTQRNIELYVIGKSPIISSVVEECLVDYADKHSAKELLQGLKFGFKINYSGPRKTCFSKNLRSTQRFPEAFVKNLKMNLN